jgi:hypothetical protein
LLEDLDYLDRSYTEDIDIGYSNPKLSYITGYQGDSPGASLILRDTNYSSKLTVDYTGATPGGFLLKKGDFIQPGRDSGYPYVYTVTGDITAAGSSGTGITVPIHRNFVPYNYPEDITFLNQPIAVGTQCRFRVQMIARPNAQVQVDQFLGFESEFVLQEVIK